MNHRNDQFCPLGGHPAHATSQGRFTLAGKKAFVCDLDGTLFMGNRPIEPALRFVRERADDFAFYYLTNNTSKTPEAYLKKIGGAGIRVSAEDILTPLTTLRDYITERNYSSVYLVANADVSAYMCELLPQVAFEYAPGGNQLVALTYDNELTYEKLRRAAVLLNANPELDYVATHADKCCPSEEGPIPDVGGIISLMHATNGSEPRHILGKPSPALLAPVLRHFERSQIAMVGDRLYTDKETADNAGIDFVCVLSGETTRESLAAYRGTPPAIVLETLGDLL